MATMKAVRIHEFGGLEKLALDDVERPEPSHEEALVRLAGTSVNPVDFKTRQGKFPPVGEDELPYILGRDVAGTVEVCGEGCDGVAVGDPVYGMPTFERGTYCEYAVLKQSELARAPETMALADAGAVPLAALTAWQGLFDHGALEAGQRVLIHGGSGGVGHFAVQFARAKGASVIATASARHQDLLRELGAETAIDYKNQRFEDVATDIDLVFDLVGGETQERSWAVLRKGGIIVSTLEQPDEQKAREAGARPGVRYMTEPSGKQLAEIAAMIDDANVRVQVSERFSLADIADAQKQLESAGPPGKIVVTIS